MDIYHLSHIETPRLWIRPVQAGDEIELDVAIQHSLPSLQRWMPWAKELNFKATYEFIQRGAYGWQSGKALDFPMIVIHKADNKIIAASGFNEKSDLTRPYFEIGYWIDSNYEGQGLASELVNGLTRYALLALEATRVQICVQIENTRSIAVAKRCGYTCEATLRHDRLDCKSAIPADSYLFACCDIATLPPLSIRWEHRPNRPKHDMQLPVMITSTHPEKLPELETSRLILKPLALENAYKLHDALLASTREVNPWFTWAKPDVAIQEISHHIEDAAQAATDIRTHDHLCFLVWHKKKGHLLGEVWYKVFDWEVAYLEINYWFDSRHAGQGFASETVSKLVHYAFQSLSAKRVQIVMSEKNERSLKLAARLGFQHEGKLKNYSRNFVTNEVMASELFAMTSLSQLNLVH